MKVRDVIKIIEADGWYHVSMKGDHKDLALGNFLSEYKKSPPLAERTPTF